MLTTITGTLVHPYGPDRAQPLAAGKAVLEIETVGVIGGAVYGPDRLRARVEAGALVDRETGEPIELAAGVWTLSVYPAGCAPSWSPLQLAIEPGMETVDLADLVPVATIDGVAMTRGPAGRSIHHVTDPNGAGKATIVYDDGTSQPWDLSALIAVLKADLLAALTRTA